MSQKELFIVRGLPGSGKSTVARSITENVFEADQFFEDESGVYRFDKSRIVDAHQDCMKRVEEAMRPDWIGHQKSTIAVANTFVKRDDFRAYIRLAKEYGYTFHVISLGSSGCSLDELHERCKHNVPKEVIQRMFMDYQHDWRSSAERTRELIRIYGKDATLGDILNKQKRSKVIYTGVFFDFSEDEKRNLLNVSNGDVMPNKYLHHVTLEFKPDPEGSHVRDVLDNEGREIRAKVVGVAVSDKVAAFQVELDPIRMSEFRLECSNKLPHLTAATAEGVTPVESNNAEYIPLDKPLTLVGRLGAYRGR